jgi:beta-glucosidase
LDTSKASNSVVLERVKLTFLETNRNPSTNKQGQKVESVSSNIDDKTLHELYLWPFADAVKAGTGNIMCSYNRVNNSYACQNSKILNGILKEELGFQGFVVSDWGALHAGYGAAAAGLDMVMPSSGGFWSTNLTAAINNGSMPASVLDNMATR